MATVRRMVPVPVPVPVLVLVVSADLVAMRTSAAARRSAMVRCTPAASPAAGNGDAHQQVRAEADDTR